MIGIIEVTPQSETILISHEDSSLAETLQRLATSEEVPTFDLTWEPPLTTNAAAAESRTELRFIADGEQLTADLDREYQRLLAQNHPLIHALAE